jgi:hypothetical protein
MVVIAVAAARIAVDARRRELSWISWIFVTGAGLKILMEDFRGGGPLAVFISLTLFGGTLVLLPRMLRAAPEPKSAMRAGA